MRTRGLLLSLALLMFVAVALVRGSGPAAWSAPPAEPPPPEGTQTYPVETAALSCTDLANWQCVETRPGLSLCRANNICIVKVDLSRNTVRPKVAIAPGGSTAYLSTIASGAGALAAVNGDYFSGCPDQTPPLNCGEGLTFVDGTDYTDYTGTEWQNRRALGFNDSYSPNIGWPSELSGYHRQALGGGPQVTFGGEYRWRCWYQGSNTEGNCPAQNNTVVINDEQFGVSAANWWQRPQTFVGYTDDRKTLFLAVTEPGWSKTPREMHDVLWVLGARYTLKMDGGGSTSMYYNDGGYSFAWNGRAVANAWVIVPYTPPTCYSLSTNVSPSGSGTVSISTAANCEGGRFSPGTVVSISANAGAGYTFSHWSGDASGTANPTTVTMDGDRNVAANFVQTETCPPGDAGGDFGSATAVTPPVDRYEYICPVADQDWYRFPVAAGQSIDVILSSLPADYDLYLYRPDGSQAASSTAGGTTAEQVHFPADAGGDWRVKVVGYSGAYSSGDSYRLQIALSTPQPDLCPLAPPGYPAPVVPSSIKGTHEASTLYAGKPTYFDWYFTNSGSAAATGQFYVELWVDSTRYVRYPFADLGAGISSGFDDWSELIGSEGTHLVKLVVDPENAVAEADETNNVWQAQYNWNGVTGWWGEYYNNEALSGDPALVRDDPVISFDWLGGSPGAGVNPDHFSARWERTVSLNGGTYRFDIFHDDGARLCVDGALVFEEWGRAREWDTVEYTLPAGAHTLRLEMYEIDGWAGISLAWQWIEGGDYRTYLPLILRTSVAGAAGRPPSPLGSATVQPMFGAGPTPQFDATGE